MIKISSQTPIQELVNNYPEIAKIMSEIGFTEILNPLMLRTAGRFMNLEKGAKFRDVPWDTIVKAFEENGFIIEDGGMENE